jgi:hypothetical protein
MKQRFFKVFLPALVIILCPIVSRAMPIVKNGQPNAAILVPASAGEELQSIAETLQHYIAKSTGATLPIQSTPGTAVSIRLQTAAALPGSPKLDEEGFILQGLNDKTFVIAGGGKRGIEFGVYEFLERYLGVRWLMPGEFGEDVPKHSTLDIPEQTVRQEPVYLSRRLGGIPGTVRDINGEWAQRNRAVWREEHGHNLLHIFPPKDYAATHPEFYPMLSGKRQIPQQGTWNWQPNFSAPGIVDEGAKQIVKYFAEHPDAPTYSIGMNDSTGTFDQSPESLARRNGRKNSQGKQDVSDDYFLWANAVATRVLQKYPGKWFGTLAYHELTDPPKPEIGVHDQIIPFMTQERLRWIDPKLREIDQQNTLGWSKVAKNLGWYDYVYGMFYLVPRTWPHLMQEYLAWGADHHVTFFTSELYPNWGEGPKGWVMAKLLWNPHQDVDVLLDDWYRHTAGNAAAPKLREYYAIWEKFWTQDILQSKWWTGAGPYLPFTSQEYLADVPLDYVERSDALLNEAFALADTPERKARVGKLRDVWQRFYKPSILVYQARQRASQPILSEAQALQMATGVEAEINESGIRQKFLHELKTHRSDPFYNYMAARPSYIDKYMGNDWGESNSLLWNLLPWIEKSAAIKARVEELTKNENWAVRQNAHILLASARGDGAPLLKNPSFEDGFAGWETSQKTLNFPATYKFDEARLPLADAIRISAEKPRSGEAGILVSAAHDGIKVLQQALIFQDVSYRAGNYYLEAHFFQPKDSPMTYVIQQTQVVDEKGQEIQNALFIPSSRKFNLQPGEWTTFRAPIILPEIENKNAKLRVTLAVRALTVVPLGNFRANQKTYVDDVNLYRLAE